jgi:hypothetical protein
MNKMQLKDKMLERNNTSSLKNIVCVFIAHMIINSILLSALNPSRCLYWIQNEFTNDESWICNWYALAHFHISVLLSCMMVKAEIEFLEKIAYLCSCIIFCYIVKGIFMIGMVDRTLSIIQCITFLGILLAIAVTSVNENSRDEDVVLSLVRKLKSYSSFDNRIKLPMASVAVFIQLISSCHRVINMTYGEGRKAYLGDMTSLNYHSISNCTVCDMVLVALIFFFVLRYCGVEQQKLVLCGHAFVLFISQVMLSSLQGDCIVSMTRVSGSIGTFLFMLISLLGAS